MFTAGDVFDGWSGYQTSILRAVEPLTSEQLTWRPGPQIRRLGESIRHLGLGRITWLSRMSAPGIEEVCAQVPRWYTDSDEARHVVEESLLFDDAGS